MLILLASLFLLRLPHHFLYLFKVFFEFLNAYFSFFSRRADSLGQVRLRLNWSWTKVRSLLSDQFLNAPLTRSLHCHVVSWTKNFTPHYLSLPSCVNAYQVRSYDPCCFMQKSVNFEQRDYGDLVIQFVCRLINERLILLIHIYYFTTSTDELCHIKS